nr:biotin/lipoyl-binding protein [Methylomarinum sp. Ch1-1]MDP4520753.1 biotin/lipoyl-binding protein [Methylomarinum sp. Ch1-1]
MQKNIRPKEIIRQRNRRLKAVTLFILLASLAYFAYWWYLNRDWVTTDDAFVGGHLIKLKAQTDGTVVEILAENTQAVKRGQVLVRLDGTKAQIDLEQAQAELGETVRNIVTLNAEVETLRQRIAAKKATMALIKHDLDRFVAAQREGAVADQKVENARDRLMALRATIAEIRAEKNGLQAQVLGELSRHTRPSRKPRVGFVALSWNISVAMSGRRYREWWLNGRLRWAIRLRPARLCW